MQSGDAVLPAALQTGAHRSKSLSPFFLERLSIKSSVEAQEKLGCAEEIIT